MTSEFPEQQDYDVPDAPAYQRSAETREKISQALQGTSMSDEHRKKLVLASLKRWARARGENPDLITMADVDLSNTKKKSSRPYKPRATSSSRKPIIELVMPDGKIAKAPEDSDAGQAITRIKVIQGWEGTPAQKDWDIVTEWLKRKPKVKPDGPAFVDCQCFAGAFTLGATQAGFSLIHKVEDTGGFGIPMCEANRDLLGDNWEAQEAAPPLWDVPEFDAALVVGNPPCSGFSVMSPKSFRGMDSDINQCMRNLFAYAKRVGPQAVVMESVPSAFKIGLPLMRELAGTFPGWHVTHVIQDNYSLGGCTKRRRYFLVVTEFPFGVEPEALKWLPTTADAIGDLEHLELTWEEQKYGVPPTWWSTRQRTATGFVDGHMTPWQSDLHRERLHAITKGDNAVDWPPGFMFDQVLKLYYEKHGDLPESWKYQSMARETRHLTRDKVLIDKDFNVGGYAQTRHWPFEEPGYVITGHGPSQAWHRAGRHFTHRETARVMGFPDDWKIAPLQSTPQLSAMWGKGISVDCGRWIATWVLNSMNGNPGSNTGDQLPDGTDRLIDVSQDWKKAPVA